MSTPMPGYQSARDIVRVCPICGFEQRRSSVTAADAATQLHATVSHSGKTPIVEVAK